MREEFVARKAIPSFRPSDSTPACGSAERAFGPGFYGPAEAGPFRGSWSSREMGSQCGRRAAESAPALESAAAMPISS